MSRKTIDPGAGVGLRNVFDICSMFPIVLKGRKRALNENDLPKTPASFDLMFESVANVADLFDERADALKETQNKWPLLARLALWERKALVYFALLIGIAHGLVNSVGRFILLRASINAVVNESPMEERGLLAFGVVAVILCEGSLLLLSKHIFADHVAHYVGGRMSTLVLRKVSRLGVRPSGAEEAQFIGADLPQVVELVRLAALLPSGLVGLVSGLFVLLIYLGWQEAMYLYRASVNLCRFRSGLVGLITLATVFKANTTLSWMAKNADAGAQGFLKNRLRAMKQVVEGIKAIKFYAWEESYAAKILGMRDIEVLALKKFKVLNTCGVMLGRAGPIIATASVFITRTAQGGALTSGEAFATLAVFQTLRVGMIFLPLAITLLGVLASNMRRTEAYLEAEEPSPMEAISDDNSLLKVLDLVASWSPSQALFRGSSSPMYFVKADDGLLLQHGGQTQHLSFDSVMSVARVVTEAIAPIASMAPEARAFDPLGLFDDEDDVDEPRSARSLKTIHEPESPRQQHSLSIDEETAVVTRGSISLEVSTLAVASGEVVAVVGQVGSGKTMLLEALLGGSPYIMTGTKHMSSSIGFVPQETLIVSGTVRENILMGRGHHQKNLDWAISAACMESDLKLLSHGVDTVVGERGTSLSGGQQQRLCIARAVYAQPELLVADDPIAAVDAVVGGKIFENLKTYVSEGKRGLLVVLNQLHLLRQCDRVVFMEHGEATVGTLEELQQSPSFLKFMSVYQSKGTEKSVDEIELESSGKVDPSEQKILVADGKQQGDVPAQLITKEASVQGVVHFEVLFQYIRSAGWVRFTFSMLVMVTSFAALACNDIWLAHWTSKVDDGTLNGGNWYYCGIYCALSGLYVVLNLGASVEFVNLSAVASNSIHGNCLATVLSAPLSWFESVPSGRILSRFSSDLGIMDVQWTFYSEGLVQLSLSGFMLLVVLAITDIYMLGVCLICGVAFIQSGSTVFMSLREFKRISNMSISPLVTNVGEAVRGRLLGRVLRVNDFFVSRHIERCNRYLTASYTSSVLIQFNGFLVQFIALWVSVTVSLYVLLDPSTNKKSAGLVLTYAFLLPYFLNLSADLSMMFFSIMPALERLFEFLPNGDLPEEPPRIKEGDSALVHGGWPSKGTLRFHNVNMRYREDLPLSLKDFNATINGGEKVGIVGRTGAGKSTLLSCLFRLCDLDSGHITLDGQDLLAVGLKTLRSALAMIPQEAVLIEGTVRENLDPFDNLGSEELERVLTKVGLSSSMLEQQVGTGGSNLSVGERQLLAIARVLLKKDCRVYVMDEPTAHIDPTTDASLQRIIRKEFANSTLLTIAHRLHTVADFDKIMVMDEGRLAEMGKPAELLQKGGVFATMVSALGPDAAEAVRKKANRNS